MRIWVSIGISTVLAVLLLVASNTMARSAQLPPAIFDENEANLSVAPARAADDISGWGSGWVTITQGTEITLTHDVGGDPDDYGVQLWFLDRNGNYGVNARGYGGLEGGGNFYGAAWTKLTSDTIRVTRSFSDTFADAVYVQIWTLDPPPDYCSEWTSIGWGATIVFTHDVGGDVDDYVVRLVFSSALSGINQRAYGGLEYGGGSHFLGAYWSHLTTSTVQVYRHTHDTFADQVRVCITRPDPPDYDSGWVTATANTVQTFTHNLGGFPVLYRVRLDSWGSVFGIHHRHIGGEVENVSPVGDNWENLTANTVNVYSRWESQRVRVRIWKRTYKVYLPLVLRRYTPPTELAYDDGTAESWQSNFTDAGFAVRFTPPVTPAQLVGARYYLNATSTAPIQVHVWGADRNDLITPFSVSPPAGIKWLEVTLSTPVTVSKDFYVGFLYTQDSEPDVGVDTTAPDGRSYEYPWMEIGSDYMIRALVREQSN
jgi:hypothetical protein